MICISPFFVRDETAHDPKSKAAPSTRGLIGMADKVFGKVVGEPRALVANVDREPVFDGARSQVDCSPCRSSGASVDQEIEYHLPYAFDGDG